MVWLVLPPIVNTGVWVLLNSSGAVELGVGADIAYPVFALTGILIWQIFLDALQVPFNIMQSFETIIKSLYFKREALLGAAALEIIFNSGIRLVLVLTGLLIFKTVFYPAALLFVFPLAVLLILGFALNLWILPFFLLYKDVGRLLGFATQFLFFLTPIIYELPDNGSVFAKIAYWNPVAPPLMACRDLLLTGVTTHWPATLWVFLLSLFLLLTGLRIFKITCMRVIERI